MLAAEENKAAAKATTTGVSTSAKSKRISKTPAVVPVTAQQSFAPVQNNTANVMMKHESGGDSDNVNTLFPTNLI